MNLPGMIATLQFKSPGKNLFITLGMVKLKIFHLLRLKVRHQRENYTKLLLVYPKKWTKAVAITMLNYGKGHVASSKLGRVATNWTLMFP